MLTVDDCNTIIEKYGDTGFWYEVDLTKCLQTSGVTTYYDFIEMKHSIGAYFMNINNPFFSGLSYCTKDGQILLYLISIFGEQGWDYRLGHAVNRIPDKLYLFITTDDSLNREYGFEVGSPLIFPISSLQVPVINGEFDDKFYFRVVRGTPTGYTINDVDVEVETDEHGTFLRLPSAEDCIIGVKSSTDEYPMYKITFYEFKTLPIPYIPTLYKGTPQTIQVLNSEDDDPISDYQTYYQGRTLKDNTIRLPYDADDYINIIVDLKDYRYPFCTVKLKAPTTIYQADSQSDVESAIENGIQTLQIGDNETEVTLNAIELSNVTLINSNIQVNESILTDCQIIDSAYTDNGGNNITNTIFKDTDYNTTAQSNYNEVTFTECDIYDSEINLTGTITDCTITDTLIISDGVINIRDNTFTGVGSKDYFPSHLYLTGEYTVTGNTFTLEGEWTELEYNMCIIKATNNFNPSQFINNNTLHLNITYQDEPVNTFYYNIVDEDKIRAVRL